MQNTPAHIQKLARGVMRLNYLKQHGFNQQNNVAQHQAKVKKQPVQPK